MQTFLTVVASWFLGATVALLAEVMQPGIHLWQMLFAGACAFLTIEFTVAAVRRAIRDEDRAKWHERIDS